MGFGFLFSIILLHISGMLLPGSFLLILTFLLFSRLHCGSYTLGLFLEADCGFSFTWDGGGRVGGDNEYGDEEPDEVLDEFEG